MYKKWTKEEETWLLNNYETAGVIESAKVLCKSESGVLHKASKLGLSRRGSDRKPRILIKDDYIWVSYKGGQEALHRMVMESVIKRPLLSTEVVHHKDGNKYNNDPSNLEVLSVSEHLKEHYANREIDELGRLK